MAQFTIIHHLTYVIQISPFDAQMINKQCFHTVGFSNLCTSLKEQTLFPIHGYKSRSIRKMFSEYEPIQLTIQSLHTHAKTDARPSFECNQIDNSWD